MENENLFSRAEKRWIVGEIQSGRMTIGSACEHFELRSKNPYALLRSWIKQYGSEIYLTLPVMTDKEKQDYDALRERLKALEKDLEHAQMKNIALETMIDIAEEKLKIDIRKKSGPKQ
jgi:transposase-like protein